MPRHNCTHASDTLTQLGPEHTRQTVCVTILCIGESNHGASLVLSKYGSDEVGTYIYKALRCKTQCDNSQNRYIVHGMHVQPFQKCSKVQIARCMPEGHSKKVSTNLS